MNGASLSDNVERFGEDQEQAHRDDCRVVARRERGEDYEKRVIGNSRWDVASSYEGSDAARELPDDLVGDLTIFRLAQLAEAVHLETQNAYGTLVALGKGDRLVELDEDEVAPGQAGRLVDQAK